MKKNQSIGIIGSGNMGRALAGVLASQRWKVFIYDIKKAKYKKAKNVYPCRTASEVIEKVPAVIIAIKPQDIPGFLLQSAVRTTFENTRPLVISIAAGVSTSCYEKKIKRIKIVRVMPNLGALCGQAVSFLCAGKNVRRKDVAFARNIFHRVGDVYVISESMLDKVTAISGSGPGYVFYFMDCLFRSALKLGFSRVLARAMVARTFSGACALAEHRKDDFKTLVEQVASKGGTTRAALDVFAQNKFEMLMANAVASAYRRARQLSNIKR
ncbi:MAG: pyrroline-5-carboxylate reductase [Candidatus Omnitrophica bacterium]|nr:pyrroline-5-carboxylate reductase [Candidatus Omnitrophota bacterium]